ncbi:MAG TPA: acyltransferase [Ktedonobacter sp.]|jgi:adenosylhomocysteine nucleosidase|nr:acyltransferase [Ktedonobacter sp.]
MPLLIITSLEEELALLTQSLRAQGFSESMQAVGKLTGHCFPTLGVTLALGGHGKAQAALQTQHAIDQSERIDLVICAGAAGALVPGIAVGDLVVAETTIEHDYLLRFVERPAPQFAGCQETLNRLRSSYYTQHPARVHYGIIASGDEDIVALERAQALHVQTEALAVAWEGACAPHPGILQLNYRAWSKSSSNASNEQRCLSSFVIIVMSCLMKPFKKS